MKWEKRERMQPEERNSVVAFDLQKEVQLTERCDRRRETEACHREIDATEEKRKAVMGWVNGSNGLGQQGCG